MVEDVILVCFKYFVKIVVFYSSEQFCYCYQTWKLESIEAMAVTATCLFILLASIYIGLCIAYYEVNAFRGEKKTVPEIIRKHGYICEEHYVTTEDGYILALHRIPSNVNQTNRAKKNPVLLQHGLLSSSGSWVLEVPFKAPAYFFADRGYDVWLGNARGNQYSRNHTYLPIDEKAFWQFSFDEMGYYDIPAVFDYIIEKTGNEQLIYIGHSMGTTMFFSGMSQRPEYNKHVRAMFALGPVATVSYIRSPIKYFSYISPFIQETYDLLGIYEFLPTDSLSMKLMKYVCTKFSLEEAVCSQMIFFITGIDWRQYNYTWLPMVLNDLLSGTSLNTVLHYAQEYKAGRYQAYNYGIIENYRRYGWLWPPAYNVTGVKVPVHLIWGANDYLADPRDIKYLILNLPFLASKTQVSDQDFNHLDFLWAKDMYQLVYKDILKKMENM